LAKRLSKDLDILLHTKVAKIDWKDGDFQLVVEEGRSWTSHKVLLTMPVPQIVQLIKNSSIDVELPILKSLHGLSFRPAYVGIYHFRQPTNLPESGHVDHDLPEGIERMVDHRKKGMSEDTIVSVYMTGKWSRNHYGEDYVLGLMQEKLADYFDWDELESEQLKRWRYAEAERTLDQPYLDLTDDGRLVAAGDAFLRPDDPAGRTRFESAFLSGLDVANHMRKK
jgi:predicted NAD/FAD-dependent oxidoreductase